MVGTKSLRHFRLARIASLVACLHLFAPIDRVTAGSVEADPDVLTQILSAISADRMLADIRTLSGSDFNGRQTGTSDDLKSAEFVQARFTALRESAVRHPGVVATATPPPTVEPFQAHPVSLTTIDDNPSLHLSLGSAHPSALIGADYLPVLDSPSADLSAPVVFAGYGIADPENGLDEYADLNVRNKIVLFLRGKPERYSRQISHADKVRAAWQHGAIGYLTTTGPLLSPYETRRGVTGLPSAFYGQTPDEQNLAGAWISTALASAILNAAGGPLGDQDRLRTLQQKLNETGIPQSVATSVTARLSWRSVTGPGTLNNVLSLILGTAQGEHARTILIGAHRDHFGRQGGLLFAGADDNASGTAVLLEVARVLALTPTAPLRSILFVSFSGEEQGLIGSREYVMHPAMPLASTVAMINVDHAGAGNGRLTVGVTGLDKQFAQQAGRTAQLEDRLDVFGFFPGGDHVPFKEAGIPTVTVVSGGIHPHFHRPTDTADTLDPLILTTVARYVTTLVWQLSTAP